MDKIKAVIFDLDGVICSTDQYHYQAWKKIADSIGVYFDKEINNRLRGVSRMASLDIILERTDREYQQCEKERLAEQKNGYYVQLLQQMTEDELLQGVMDTLNQLRQRGYAMAIGSSSKNTKLILSKLKLDTFFDAISDGTNITHSKPDPEVFLKAAEYLGKKPAECLVVEDAYAGAEAAYRGGFACVGVGEANRHEHITYQLNEISDLLKYL